MKFKSNVVQIIKDFIAFVERQFHTLVIGVRSDNAKELTERELLSFYTKKGPHRSEELY